MNGRKCRRRTLNSAELTRDYLDLAAQRQRDAAHFGVSYRLIFRLRHLVFRRQIYPKLDHLKRPARAIVFLLVIFLVQQTASGRHPLNVTFADHAAAAATVVVLDSYTRSKLSIRWRGAPARWLPRRKLVSFVSEKERPFFRVSALAEKIMHATRRQLLLRRRTTIFDFSLFRFLIAVISILPFTLRSHVKILCRKPATYYKNESTENEWTINAVQD